MFVMSMGFVFACLSWGCLECGGVSYLCVWVGVLFGRVFMALVLWFGCDVCFMA